MLGIAICLVLITRVDFGQSLILLATITIALLNWVLCESSRASCRSSMKICHPERSVGSMHFASAQGTAWPSRR